MMVVRIVMSTLIAACLVPSITETAFGQNSLRSPIKFVVPFPAGGPTDIAARLMNHAFSPQIGRSVIIEIQREAGGALGARQVAVAAPDGATLLIAGVSSFCTAPLLYQLGYEPIKA